MTAPHSAHLLSITIKTLLGFFEMGSAQVAVGLLDHLDAGARHPGDGEHIDAGHQGLGYPQMSEIIDRDVLTGGREPPDLPKSLIDRILVPRTSVVLGEDRIVRL